jgi:hypothetical protein
MAFLGPAARLGKRALNWTRSVLLADVDRAHVWELDPRLGFFLCPAGRDRIGDGPVSGMRVSTLSAGTISSELSHWSTIARLPDITVAATGWEQIGLQRSNASCASRLLAA